MISSEWWSRYEKKYGKLMWKIASKIGGDAAITSLEDNYNELCVAALESVAAFQKLTNREDIDAYLEDKEFDQYTKTVLWNRKSNIGKPITNKMKKARIFNESVLEEDSGEDGGSFGFLDSIIKDSLDVSSVEFEDLCQAVPDKSKKILRALIMNPDCILQDGSVNISELSKRENTSYNSTKKAYKKLKSQMRKYK